MKRPGRDHQDHNIDQCDTEEKYQQYLTKCAASLHGVKYIQRSRFFLCDLGSAICRSFVCMEALHPGGSIACMSMGQRYAFISIAEGQALYSAHKSSLLGAWIFMCRLANLRQVH